MDFFSLDLPVFPDKVRSSSRWNDARIFFSVPPQGSLAYPSSPPETVCFVDFASANFLKGIKEDGSWVPRTSPLFSERGSCLIFDGYVASPLVGRRRTNFSLLAVSLFLFFDSRVEVNVRDEGFLSRSPPL